MSRKHNEDLDNQCYELIWKMKMFKEDCSDVQDAHDYEKAEILLRNAEILLTNKDIHTTLRDSLKEEKIHFLNTLHTLLKKAVADATKSLITSLHETTSLDTFTQFDDIVMLFCKNYTFDEKKKMQLKMSCAKLNSLIENYPTFSNLMREIKWLQSSPQNYSQEEVSNIYERLHHIIKWPEMDVEYKLQL